MNKTLTALAAAATIAVAAVAVPTQADARRGGWHGGGHRHGGGWRGYGPGIVGGLAAGALIGGAYAYGPGYYGYGPGYYAYGGELLHPPALDAVWLAVRGGSATDRDLLLIAANPRKPDGSSPGIPEYEPPD